MNQNYERRNIAITLFVGLVLMAVLLAFSNPIHVDGLPPSPTRKPIKSITPTSAPEEEFELYLPLILSDGYRPTSPPPDFQ